MAGKPQTADFLVEIGTEELPPKALRELSESFARNLAEVLDRERLAHAGLRSFASPRRLAVLVRELALSQPERQLQQKGPPVSVAFDSDGRATAAALAFAARCGVAVDALGRSSTEKGEWLSCRTLEAGRDAADLLPGAVLAALDSLPIPRRMRWGSVDFEFVRPVHWVLMLHGRQLVEGSVLGVNAGRFTRGHRFLAPGELSIDRPSDYARVLERDGCVVADFARRRERVVAGVRDAAARAGGTPVGSDALYDEVTALVEWPVALTGAFEERFLRLPREVVTATLASHQRYFPIADAGGRLLPGFVTVANIESRDPDKVREGNERVVRPRLADAEFFWEQDRKVPLAERRSALGEVVYQQKLGSLRDKAERIAVIAELLATRLAADPAAARRSAELCKCDLLTGMVGEFPELQGVMGGYYAGSSGESPAVVQAIAEQYRPRFAGDALPETATGQILAIADRLDTLGGSFALGKRPGGSRDPFGLRRAAQGVVRIIVERRLDLDLKALLETACSLQPVEEKNPRETAGEMYDFILDRMRAWYTADLGFAPEVFAAVRARRPASLLDLHERVLAVAAFLELEAAHSLAAADKRIANILRQAGEAAYGELDAGALVDDAERALYQAMQTASAKVAPLLEQRAYTEALATLAELRESVDQYFDRVMVMTDAEDLQRNRLATLAELRALFLRIADISRLSIA